MNILLKSRGFRGILFLMVVLHTFGWAAGYETPPAFESAKVLPPELLKDPDHQVLDPVQNDGYLNNFKLKSRFGEFSARGLFLLRVRAQEINALVELDDVSKTKVFMESAKNSALGPVNSVVEFSKDPAETIKQVPGGVGRMFKKIGRTAKGVASNDDESDSESEPDKESTSAALVKKYFGVTGAERKWAQKVGVDPYSFNDVLNKAIHNIAVVDRAGSFTVKLAPIPRVPGLGTVDTVYSIAWSKDPYELMDFNKKRLASMGVTEEVIEKFFKNGWLNPTHQTAVIGILSELPKVSDRSLVIEQSLDVESEVQAAFFVENLSMLSWFHKKKGGLKKFHAETALPVAEAGNGKLIAMVSTDYIAWTKETEEGVGRLTEAYKTFGQKELWLRGGISETCRAEVVKKGWTVHSDTTLN